MLQFVPALEAAGAHVDVRPFFHDRYLRGYFSSGRRSFAELGRGLIRRLGVLVAARGYSAIWIEKELFPYLPGFVEGAIRIAGAPYVVDYDDAQFHIYDSHKSRFVRRVLGRKLDSLLAGSAVVTVGNAYLADYVRRHGARTIVRIPTVADPARYPVRRHSNAGPIRVGWIGTPENARQIGRIREVLRRVAAEVPIRLVTIGAPCLEGLEALQDRLPWSEATEGELVASLDIGIMPLADGLWEQGKCGGKLIQYMAAGLPVIASPVGVNRDIVTRDIGYLAEDDGAWYEALTALATDADRRARMGSASRARFESDYSTTVVAPRLIDLFAAMSKPAG